MISEKQLEANRNNALLSHGPVTDAGRKRSSMNALRHGLTGQVTTMTDEDRTAHEKFSKALIQDLAPSGAMETQLAQRIATNSWRFNRISAVEDNLFALGLHEHGGQLNLDHEQIDAAPDRRRLRWNGQAGSPEWTGAAKHPWSAASAPHALRAAYQSEPSKEPNYAEAAPGHPQSGARSRYERSGHSPETQ
jgi:hypothetical protein